MKSATQLKLGALHQLSVRVSTHPGFSVRSLFTDLLGGPPQGVPPRIRRRLRAALPPDSAHLLQSLFAHAHTPLPCLLTTGIDPFADGGVEAQLARIRDLSAEAVQNAVVTHLPDPRSALRERLYEHPLVFSAAAAHVQEAIWRAYQPLWQRTAAVRDRETARIGTALVTDQFDLVLTGLGPNCELADSSLFFNDPARLHRSPTAPSSAEPSDRLVLVPLFSGQTATAACTVRAGALIGYPPSGLTRLWDGAEAPAASNALVLVLGEQRAAILRHSVRGTTMTDLANRLGCSPATATYHCAQLERAGLVQRLRQGRTVRLRLTTRGAHLIDLLL
ncbi:MarR family transcriptional regulator [Streptomyces sp. HSW2009]|uniref:MarR family transcriptional regulator n=1 Tax=Streptomyces sp. HSW2009 TaxID=3142890 RepID=UPI0032EDF527